jgi:Rrf2 family iron-sulfur cluster assembly transcriptional regulator
MLMISLQTSQQRSVGSNESQIRSGERAMSLIFSRQCEYALQAVLYLALKNPGEWASIREITGRLQIPVHFLAKTLQDLTRKKLLVSLKGPTGGFALARSTKRLKLLKVVEAIDGNDLFERCVMGFAECSSGNPCAVHKDWLELRRGLERMLATKSVVEVAREMHKAGYGR